MMKPKRNKRLDEILLLAPPSLAEIGLRIKACLMIAASEPREGRVVDRHLSQRAKDLIAEADKIRKRYK